jgi:signal transduction histidine kinase
MQNLAHELSTPLTPLAGYLRILQGGKLGSLAPPQQRIVDAMMQSVARLSRIVDNLADFASLQAGRAPILEGVVDPDAMAEDVVSELRAAIKDARLSVEIARAGGERVVADPRKLRQALANLVGNAVKFSPHGGQVLVEVAREPGKLRFTVYDQGPGIRAGESERIFEPLHHAAARGHEEARAPGSGLGLPVARRIAEAHGGRVWVESPPRTQPSASVRHFTGSKFVLEVPVRPADRPGAGPGHAASGA